MDWVVEITSLCLLLTSILAQSGRKNRLQTGRPDLPVSRRHGPNLPVSHPWENVLSLTSDLLSRTREQVIAGSRSGMSVVAFRTAPLIGGLLLFALLKTTLTQYLIFQDFVDESFVQLMTDEGSTKKRFLFVSCVIFTCFSPNEFHLTHTNS